MFTRHVNTQLLEAELGKHGKGKVAKFAVKSKTSTTTVMATRRGYVPTREETRRKLCQALGVGEDVLFPVAGTDKNQAS